MDRSPSNQAATVGGVVLVGLGLVFLAQQALGIDIGHWAWPIFIILPGLAFLTAYALGPRSAAAMAVPGCVVTTVGLILAVQNTFGLWQTWRTPGRWRPAQLGSACDFRASGSISRE